jgi:hypothetical protein
VGGWAKWLWCVGGAPLIDDIVGGGQRDGGHNEGGGKLIEANDGGDKLLLLPCPTGLE